MPDGMTDPAFNFEHHEFFSQPALVITVEHIGDGIGRDELVEKGRVEIFTCFRGNIGVGAVKKQVGWITGSLCQAEKPLPPRWGEGDCSGHPTTGLPLTAAGQPGGRLYRIHTEFFCKHFFSLPTHARMNGIQESHEKM